MMVHTNRYWIGLWWAAIYLNHYPLPPSPLDHRRLEPERESSLLVAGPGGASFVTGTESVGVRA